jgi:hypothetical protein
MCSAGGTQVLRWLVGADVTGLVIGKKGQGIQGIFHETGARVRVGHEQELPRGSNERCAVRRPDNMTCPSSCQGS